MSTRTIHKLKNYLAEKDREIADLKREVERLREAFKMASNLIKEGV